MFKILEKDGEEYAYIDPLYKKDIAKKKYGLLLNLSGIPKFYWNIEFEDYKGTISLENVDKLKYYVENFKEEKFNHVHLYLHGINNCQKTALACNVGKEIIRQGYSCKFLLAGSLINKLLKLQGYGIQEELELEIKKLKESDVLIIDDIFDVTKSLLWSKPESASLIITAWDSFIRDVVASNTKLVLTSNIPVNIIKQKFKESMFHLIDRNFLCLGFHDDVKPYRKENFENLFPKG